MEHAEDLRLKRTEEIRSIARRLGFHQVGVTSADPVEEAGRLFSQWLADGFSAEMAYLQKSPEIRSDPRRRFPEAKSVICLALNYYQSPRKRFPPQKNISPWEKSPATPGGKITTRLSRRSWNP